MKITGAMAGVAACALLLTGCNTSSEDTAEASDAKPAPAKASAAVAAPEPADLRDAYYACANVIEETYTGGRLRGARWLELEDDGQTIVVDGKGASINSFDAGWCVLEELDAPVSVLTKVETTNAAMSRQTDTWGGNGADYEAAWTYGDNGLDMVVEVA